MSKLNSADLKELIALYLFLEKTEAATPTMQTFGGESLPERAEAKRACGEKIKTLSQAQKTELLSLVFWGSGDGVTSFSEAKMAAHDEAYLENKLGGYRAEIFLRYLLDGMIKMHR